MSTDDAQRMKDLANRMVAMSPEPPPFPEEVVMTAPARRSRWTPALVVAAAAALVLFGAAIPILLRGPDEPGPATTLPPVVTTTPPVNTTVPANTTVPVDTTAPVETTTTTVAPATLYTTSVFLVESPANSNTGNPALVPFLTTVSAPGLEPGAALVGTPLLEPTLQLLTNDALVPPEGFETLIPDGVRVNSVSTEDRAGIATVVVDMNDQFLAGAGGLLADVTMLNQLVFTATQYGAEQVVFTVGGQPIEAYGTEGIVLTDPITRDDYLDSMNSIIITQPLIYGGDGLPMVTGIANVFEATVALEIVESESGQPVYSDFTTATCGTGCWGEFSFSLDTPELTPQRTVLVYWNSPKDGAPSDVVRIPINPEEAWNLLPES